MGHQRPRHGNEVGLVRPRSAAGAVSERVKAETLFPSHALFMKAHEGQSIASVQTIVTYVKQLDDTIYAGVEHTVQEGLAPTVESKRTILDGVVDYLSAHRSAAGDEALVVVAAALRLGGDQPATPTDLATRVDAAQQEFLASPSESKPIGFYTWSSELEGIWHQDRLLQRPLPSACATTRRPRMRSRRQSSPGSDARGAID